MASDRPPATPTDDAPSDDVPRLALRPKEAAQALGIGVRLLWSKTNSGEIPAVKIGARTVYPVALIEEYLAEQARKQGGVR